MDQDKKRNKKDEKDLKSIRSSALSRGLAMLNMSVNTGSKLAMVTVGNVFRDKEDRDEKWQDFLKFSASNLAKELGNLKGSLMKTGQLLSVYGEHFFPPEVNSILKTLQADSKPLAWSAIKKVLVAELGSSKLQELEIDPTPINAASLGQVHRARRKSDGLEIALKIQYPGVAQAIDSDLATLRTILSISKLAPKTHSFEELFNEVRMMLHNEIDYEREAELTKEFAESLKDDPRFVIPKIIDEYCSSQVIASTLEIGDPVTSDGILGLPQHRRNKIGAAIIDLMFKEIFELRLVQTDTHFGNYRVRSDKDGNDCIILFDFGAVRKFPKRYIDPFASLIRSAISGSRKNMIQAGADLGYLRPEDADGILDLFCTMCEMVVEPFATECLTDAESLRRDDAVGYDWGKSDLLDRLALRVKDAALAVRFRPPPRETVFLDRKLIGIYIFLKALKVKFGPRDVILKYLDQ